MVLTPRFWRHAAAECLPKLFARRERLVPLSRKHGLRIGDGNSGQARRAAGERRSLATAAAAASLPATPPTAAATSLRPPPEPKCIGQTVLFENITKQQHLPVLQGGIPVMELVLARSLVLLCLSTFMLAREGRQAEWPWRSARSGEGSGGGVWPHVGSRCGSSIEPHVGAAQLCRTHASSDGSRRHQHMMGNQQILRLPTPHAAV